MICSFCEKEMPEEGAQPTRDGRIKCIDCRVEWLKGFTHFTDYWLKYKVQSEHGIEINTEIARKNKEQLKDAIEQQRKIRQKYSSSRRKSTSR